MSYQFEAPPLHSVIFVSTLPSMEQVPHEPFNALLHNYALLTLLRDGFHDESPGGRVKLPWQRPLRCSAIR